MEKFIDLISRRVSQAFEEAGLEGSLGKVTLSNRPDLCEYQCNGAMPAAKKAHRPPLLYVYLLRSSRGKRCSQRWRR